MAAKDYSSDSEGHGADVTTTAVHDSPFEVPQDPDQSMQVDDLAGVDIPSDMQENQEGRDIQGYLESLNRSPTTEISSSSDAEVPEAPVRLSAGPRMWIHRGRSNLAVSLQQRLRLHMGGALEALLAQDDVEPEETGSHSMASDHYPAATPRLHMSDQSLETEHHIERDATGGAVSVKLVSWSEPLKVTANHPDVVERNARYLGRLYHEAKIKEPPIMEWTFLANAMQAYTGDKGTLFSHVVCMESKQHMFWIHYLREPFSTKAGDSAVHRYTLHFGHGTNTAGVEGIMNSCYLAPATIADGAGAVGHYSQASPWGDSDSLKAVLDRVVQSGKWQCPLMVHGFVMTPAAHHVMESGGGSEAQQACMIHAAVHFKRDKKWLLHSDLTTVTSFVIAVKKQFQPLRDHLGRPMFQLGPTHADTVKQHVRGYPCYFSDAPWHDRDRGGTILDRAAATEGDQHIAESEVHPDSLQPIVVRNLLSFRGTGDRAPPSTDTNRECGLNLPRQVISNKFTRDLQSDGMDIFAVRLAQVMTGGLNNWGLRSLANGRHTVWELFKSRQEAITAGTLMRALRGQDPYLWDNRYMAIKDLAKELAKLVEEWEGPPEEFALGDEHEDNDELVTLPGSPDYHPEDYEDADHADPLETVQQFERTTQPRFLEECKVDNYKVNTINNWVSQRVGKEKMKQVRLAGSELAAAIERLPAGNRPAIDAIAVQWGLPVSAAAKINERSLYQLIATCHVLGLKLFAFFRPYFLRKAFMAPSSFANFDNFSMHARQQIDLFAEPIDMHGADMSPWQSTNVRLLTLPRPTRSWKANLADTTFLQEDRWKAQEHFGQDLDSLTFQVDHKAGTKDLRSVAMSMPGENATPATQSEGLAGIQRSLIQCQNYQTGRQCTLFQATNTAISQLQDRVEALEQELKSLKQVLHALCSPSTGSFDSTLRTPEEIDSSLAKDSDNGWMSSGFTSDSTITSGENLDGSKKFRLIVKSCRKKVFLRRMQATKDLDDDFYIPNRAKLILDFLKNHGDRRVRERNGPRQSFPSTLALLEHVMTASGSRMESILPPERGVCV
ncbi:ATG26 [Symbiodinium microadriaticum]|nr:ATG26 [Symbiodinium microadriaticum]